MVRETLAEPSKFSATAECKYVSEGSRRGLRGIRRSGVSLPRSGASLPTVFCRVGVEPADLVLLHEFAWCLIEEFVAYDDYDW